MSPAAFSRVPAAPRSDDPDAIEAFRQVLEAADFTVEGVSHHLGDAAVQALSRDQAVPALLALDGHRDAGTWNALSALIHMFILARPLSTHDFHAVLPQVEPTKWAELGLVEYLPGTAVGATTETDAADGATGTDTDRGPVTTAGGGDAAGAWIRSIVDLDLHSSDSGLDLWVAADLTAFQRPGAALRHDHVLGIGGASLTLAQITERRPVERALDIGTGCGIQVFHLLEHARHVVATDLSERALAFTRFNLMLNAPALGLDAHNLAARVDLRQGSLLEPVAGELFDLVVTNPPFVITPRTAGESAGDRYTYRDAGKPGDSLVAELVSSLHTVMAPGATAHLLANWEIPREQGVANWSRRVSSWIPEVLDAWLIQRETETPEQYAETWLRDASEHLERSRYEAAYRAYLEDFSSRDVEAVGFGYLRMEFPEEGRQRRRRCEEVTHPLQQPIAVVTAATVERQNVLDALGQRWVDLHLSVPEHVTEERHGRPGAPDPSVILLRQGAGMQRTAVLTSATAGLVGACDGELSVAQIVSALAALLEWEAPEGQGAESSEEAQAVLAETRHLLIDGFLQAD
ncbi:DUF7059 domain-containing protein [Kocuria sp.]|uniref:DUF7059 domain-containing protein n=1 Tax=Kocuria sp. TaxID=1871328 RepID=UPI0026DFBE7B|nr:methyltransferase [Kocuria sp.]MDO5618557.1 methyltransferase [Kocuria sp.]